MNIFERIIQRMRGALSKSLYDLYPEQALREPLLRVNSEEETGYILRYAS